MDATNLPPAQQPQLFMRRPNLDALPPLEPPPGYTVRLMRPGEEALVAAALLGAFPDYVWTAEKVLNSLVNAPDVTATYVVAWEDTPVATASARDAPNRWPGSGYLHWVGVRPDHWGKRLGRLVTVRVLHHFRAAGCRDSVLETDDFRLPAIRIYLALGYVPENYHPNHAERWEKVLEALDRPPG